MSSDSSEAKQIPSVTDAQSGPSIGVLPTQPVDPEIFAEKLPIHSLPPNSTGTDQDDESASTSQSPWFVERIASFLFKIFLVSTLFFTAGAAVAVTILMDLLDLKTGWIKTLLQFIKEASKIIQ